MHSAELPSSRRFQIVEQFVHFDVDLWFEGQISKRFGRKSRSELDFPWQESSGSPSLLP